LFTDEFVRERITLRQYGFCLDIEAGIRFHAASFLGNHDAVAVAVQVPVQIFDSGGKRKGGVEKVIRFQGRFDDRR
jgi:hypothetical protein